MPELDALKEELAYLRLWLGMLAVTHISLIGWTASSVETASARLLTLAVAVIIGLGTNVYPEAKRLDLVIGILMLATALLFGGIALHAGREKKPPSRTTD